MKRALLCIGLLGCTAITAFSQYIGGFRNDYGKSFCVQEEAYYIIGSSRSYGAGSDDIYLVKVGADLNTIWEKTWGFGTRDIGEKIIATSDGNLVYTGYSWDSPGPGYGDDIIIAKMDPDGETLWMTHYGGAATDRSFDVVETMDGGYLVIGMARGVSVLGSPFLLKLNSAGDIMWSRNYTFEHKGLGKSVVESADGSIYGLFEDNGFIDQTVRSSEYKGQKPASIWLMKMDPLGNELWRKELEGSGHQMAGQLRINNDALFVIGSSESRNGSFDMQLIKLDFNGNEIFKKFFGGNNYEYGSSIDFAASGDMLCTGTTGGEPGDLNSRVFVVRTDASGELKNENEYGSVFSSLGEDAVLGTDQSHTILGSALVPVNADVFQYELYFIRTDSIGSVKKLVDGMEDDLERQVFPKLVFYPNPTDGPLTLSIDYAAFNKGQLSILNLEGKLLIQEEIRSTTTTFNWQDQMIPGIYVYKLQLGVHLFYGKIQIR